MLILAKKAIDMFHFFKKHKSEASKLERHYCKLMRKAYKIAPKDKSKSDLLHQEAHKIKKRLLDLGTSTSKQA